MVKNNNKDKDHSSNSLVFGRWPQTKIHFKFAIHKLLHTRLVYQLDLGYGKIS